MVILSKFAENLSALMVEQNLNPPALAKILKTDRTNITRYLRGERLPNFHGFIAIADYFGVSADLLLGKTDYASEQNFLSLPPFGDNLRKVMQENKITQYRLEKDLNLSGSVVYNWLTNRSFPSIEKVVKLADYMDCSVDYLLGRTN